MTEQANTVHQVQSQWVMCFLRDMSPESALEHYLAPLPYRDMIIGVGSDSLETDRPPLLFGEVFSRAREDGFRITCHCDVGDKDTLRNIDQVFHHLGGTGADRVDHGLDAVDEPMLLEALNEKDMGMTICPWGYLCYSGQENVLDRVCRLHSAGVNIAIGSDAMLSGRRSWDVPGRKVIASRQMLNGRDGSVKRVMKQDRHSDDCKNGVDTVSR